MRPRKGDFLIALIILVTASALWVYPFLRTAENARHAVVMQDGEVLYTLALNRDKTINLPEATISVSDGGVAIIRSTCPDQICVNTGRIDKPGQSIVCVPHRIIIQIPYDESGEADIIVS